MKYLILISTLVFSSAAFSETKYVASVDCKATGFRANMTEPETDYGVFYGQIENTDGVYALREYGGYFSIGGYHGVFHGETHVEKPYKKASTYKNHLRFDDMNAIFTAGSESGMWGALSLNKDVIARKVGSKVDAHYVFQAGDHMGGTIDFECTVD